MKKNYLLSQGLDIIEFTGNILLEKLEEISQNIIVFPGKRPGHFLRKYIAEKIKQPFVSPKILSMDEFIDFVYTELLGYVDRMAGPIDSAPIIFNLNKSERLIDLKESQLYLDEFLLWCFKLFADFEEMNIEEIKPSKLREIDEIAGEQLPPKISENLIKLSRLYELFYEQLHKLNLSTRSLRYNKVGKEINNVDFSPFKKIIFVGFFALTNSEKRMLSYLAQDERVIFIFQKGSGIDGTLKELKIDVSEVNIEKEPPEINFYQAMDVHSEVFKLNQLISRKTDFTCKDVIVLPLADTLFPVVQHTVGFTNKEYNISMGYPISRTPVYAIIQILSELLETKQGKEYYVPSYFKFVLHPYVKNIYFENASYVTRIIFHTIEDNFMEEQRRFITLDEIEDNKKIIEECLKRLKKYKNLRIDQEKIKNHLHMIHKTLVKPFEDIKDIGDFTDKFLTFFSFISDNSPANLHPFTAPFIRTVLESIYELKTSDLKNERFKETDSYFRLLKNFLRTVSYPFSGTPVRGLQVLGFLETRNIKFDNVYILDVNEGILPNTKKEDTILPHGIRAYLGLPTYEASEKIFRYYFETLLAGAKEVHIFYIEGADKEKSRFVEKLLWKQQQKAGKLSITKNDIFFNVQFSQKEPASIEKTKDIVQYITDNLNFTPTKLDVYLQCPLSFYYSEVVGLSAREEISGEPDALKIGGIVHSVLERFFTPRIGQSLVIKKEDYKTMDDIVEEVFNERFQNSSEGSLYLIKMQIKKRMSEVLNFYQDKDFSRRVIVEIEGNKNPIYKPNRKFRSECSIKLSNGKCVKMVGKIDRVDREGDSYYIIDYKTGANPEIPAIEKFDINKREEWLKTFKSVQLPSYLIIYLSNNLGITIQNLNAGLMILGGKEIKERYLFSKDDEKDAFEHLKKGVLMLIEEILDPDIPFMPTIETEKCSYCEFNVICGRQWVEKRW
uniref:PD-(D/E)XK nuclease family protein n=1 Tax=candidate division WOR-3 bacterium TaxID=2052148 RepID=A0A7V0Z5V0_UNCW3